MPKNIRLREHIEWLLRRHGPLTSRQLTDKVKLLSRDGASINEVAGALIVDKRFLKEEGIWRLNNE